MVQRPDVSVIVPMLNEADHVEALVSDIAAQDFTGSVEVIVADGGSTDGSPDALRTVAGRAGLDLQVIDNPHRWVSPGLNACIERASGDVLVRLDCHSRYPTNYIRRCVELAREPGAWLVGGRFEARGRTSTERMVATAYSSPFGGTAWTRHAGEGGPVEADTVPFGAFRPEAFERAGLFDETLVRNQDDELAFRIRRAGGRVVMDPNLLVYYVPRGTLRGVFTQHFQYGYWKVAVMLRHRTVISTRSLAPIAFIGSLAGLGAATPFSGTARVLLTGEAGAYALSALAFGALALRRRGEPVARAPQIASIFFTMHAAYGLGMAAGWVAAAAGRFRAANAPLRSG